MAASSIKVVLNIGREDSRIRCRPWMTSGPVEIEGVRLSGPQSRAPIELPRETDSDVEAWWDYAV
jgi:hypothetical protein